MQPQIKSTVLLATSSILLLLFLFVLTQWDDSNNNNNNNKEQQQRFIPPLSFFQQQQQQQQQQENNNNNNNNNNWNSIFKGFTNDVLVQNEFNNNKQTTNKMLPTVLVHGMGDSCFNPGFSSLTDLVADYTQQPAICIPAGNTLETDTTNTFFLNMNLQVKAFAKIVRADSRLAAGMNAIGLSQGNLVIRAYIQLINDPPIVGFVSVHGPMAGVGGIPRCDPMKGFAKYMCELVDNAVGDLAYNSITQNSLSEANFLRDPARIPEYLDKCLFLPDILDKATPAQRDNLLKLKHFALVLAERDTMIIPRESEWFGAFEDGNTWQNQKVIGMESQSWYKLLGLDELKSTNRLHQLTTKGDHLQFSRTELSTWISSFFV